MKLKKIIASILAICMVLSNMSIPVSAEETVGETVVATVDGVEYTDIQAAITAAAPNKTVEVLSDVVVDEWKMFWQGDSTFKEIIYIDMDGLTINGNGYTLTVKNIVSATNGDQLFREAENLNVTNWEIVQPAKKGGISLVSGTLDGVTFQGGNGVFPWDGEIVINECTFNTDNYCIYSEKENNGLKVTNSTFNGGNENNVIFLRGNTVFTGNTILTGAKVRVVEGSPVVSGNDFGDVIVKVYNNATATIEDNTINTIEIEKPAEAVNSTFSANTLSEDAETTLKDAGVIEDTSVETAAAQIGNKTYSTLAEAIEEAQNGDTVTLLSDLTIESDLNSAAKGYFNIAEKDKITLDLGGKTINVTDNSTGNFILFYNYGDLTIKNGTVNLTATNNREWNAESAIVLNRGGNLTIESGTYTHNGGTDMAFVFDNSGNYFGDAITDIEGGTLTSAYIAIRNRMEQNSHGASGKATLNISGGTITGTSRAVWAQAASTSETSPATGAINVTGGEVGLIDTARSSGAECMTTISGGTVEAFKGEAGELTVTENGRITGAVTILTASGEEVDYVVDENGVYVEAPAPVTVNAYVSQDTHVNGWTTVWGQLAITGTENFYIEIYSGETYLGKTTLVDTEKVFLDGAKHEVTWHAFLDGSDSWWNTEWGVAPVSNLAPTGVKYYVDDTLIGTGVVKMSSADDLNPVVWEELRGVSTPVTGLEGEGTKENPYLISNLAELKWFRDDVNGGNRYAGKYIKLTDDINLNNEEWAPIGTEDNAFQGHFDGDNHTISNLLITGYNSVVGLFGRTNNNGSIKNLTLNNAQVSGRLEVGALVGTPSTFAYSNIKLTGHVEVNGMSYVGGVGGKNAYGNWTDITVNVDETSYVKATSTENGKSYRTYVGGVVGFNGEGGHTFKNITSNIDVIGDVCDIGGIFGIAHYGNNFENITCTGDVTNNNNTADKTTDVLETGLIAGVWHNQVGNEVKFTNINATGKITATYVPEASFVNGGLIGNAYNANNETADTSGSLIVDGKEVWIKVAKIGDTGYATLAEAVAAVKDGETINILSGEISEGTIKLPATLKNVTIKGEEGAVLKDMTISAADGNSLDYDGITYDGITFDNSRILITGWRTNGVDIKNLTITNCIFKNLYDTTNNAAVHVNVAETEAIENFTFTNNVIDGATGGSKSGIYMAGTGNVTVTGNTFNNIVFRPALIQLADCDGTVDNVVVSDNVISNTTRLQIYGSEEGPKEGPWTPSGTDTLKIAINENIFKNISGYYICTWGINGEADIAENYYDTTDLSGKIYWNNETPTDEAGLAELGIYPIYTELNEDGTINLESKYAPFIASGEIAYRAYIGDTADREAIKVDLQNVSASSSVVVKLYDSNDNLLTTTTLKAGAYEGEWLTTNIVLWGTESGSWDTVINAEKLTVANVPTKIELYIDGELTDTFENALGNATDAAAYQLPAYLALDCVYKEAQIGDTYYVTLADAITAAASDDTITMLADVTIGATTNIAKSVTINGNGYKIKQSADFSSNAGNTVFDIMSGATVTFNNVIFDGIKDVAIMRTVSANVVMDNCVVTNCEQTVSQGLLRLACGNATITNSQFVNNNCTMVISFGYDAANDTDVLTIDGCLFERNTCGETAVVYFADGDYGKVTNTKFIDNNVSAIENAATLYMGWGDGFEVSGCTFEGNTVTTSHATTKRFASAIFCDGCTVNENIFKNNTAIRNGETIATTVAVAAYYGAADVSANYWNDGTEPVVGEDYTVEYTRQPADNDSYYATCTEDGNGKYILSDLVITKMVAQVGDTKYTTLADAVANAISGDTITMLSDVTLSETVTLPAGITFNGNGKTITGNVIAGGDLTFEGYTKVTTFNAGYNKPTITIGEGATLETTSGRMVIGHGAIFNITGSITDAKTTDTANITPSLIAPGASFTGAGVNFNVTNAYVKFTAYCSSKNSNASGTFNLNVTNSIWEQAGSLVFSEPTNSMDPTFNFTVKDSVLNSTSHLVFAVTKGDIVFDNSLVNNGTARQLENRSNLTIKNGSVVYASVQTSSNAKNPGTTIVDNATYVTTGTFGGADVGTGTLILQNEASFTTGTLSKVKVTVDGTSLLTATKADTTTTTVTVDGSALEVGDEVKVIDLNGSASIEGIVTVQGKGVVAIYGDDGDVTITKQAVPVASVTDAEGNVTNYTDLQTALKALTAGATLTLLDDVTITEAWDNRYTGAKITVPVTIDGNGKTIKFTNAVADGGNYHAAFRFQAAATVKNLTVDMSEATTTNNRLRAISSSANLTVDICNFIGNPAYTNCRAVIYGEGAGANVGNLEISITNSTFKDWKRGVVDNENTQDVKTVAVTGNTFTNAGVALSATDTITFTDNTVNNAYVTIKSYTESSTLAVTATGNTLTANDEVAGTMNYIDVATTNVTAQEEFYIVAPELPTATVTELENEDLTFALNFVADEATAEQLAYYGNWYADFVLTVNKDVTFNANGGADGYLSGQYDAWSENWVNVPFEDVTLNAGESLRIMEYAAELMGQPGLKFTYKDVYDFVKNFDCGVFFESEFLAENPDLEVTLELRIYNSADESESYAIGETYAFEFEGVAYNTVTKVIYEDVSEALLAAKANETVILLADAEDSMVLVTPGVTLDLNGYSLTSDYVASYGHIVDTADIKGTLKVAADCVHIYKGNEYLPVKNEGGYQFYKVKEIKQVLQDNNTAFKFLPYFEETLHEILLNGQETTGITINVRLSWTQDQGVRSQDFVYYDEIVSNVIRSYNATTENYGRLFTLTVTGTEGLENLCFEVAIVSDTGVEITSQKLSVQTTANK